MVHLNIPDPQLLQPPRSSAFQPVVPAAVRAVPHAQLASALAAWCRDFSLHYLVCQRPPEYLRWRVLWPCSAILIQEKYRRPWWILTS